MFNDNPKLQDLRNEINRQEPSAFGFPMAKDDVSWGGRKSHTYICPNCGHGKGGDGISRKTVDDVYYCQNCGESYDVIGLYQIDRGLEQDTKQAMKELAKLYNLDFPLSADYKPNQQNGTDRRAKPPVERVQTERKQAEQKEEKPIDYSKYFEKCYQNREKAIEYLKGRGISRETAEKFKIGYDEHCMDIGGTVIIPTSTASYTARAITETDKEKRCRHKGSNHFLNMEVLKTADSPVFVVEGEIDTLSIEEVGGHSIALGGVSNAEAFIKELQELKPKAPIIFALDNDDVGQRTQEEISKTLKSLTEVTTARMNFYGAYKDSNEFLTADREKFKECIGQLSSISAEQLREFELKKTRKEREKKSAGAKMNGFLEYVKDKARTEAVPTGYKELDRVLDGGLYEGLYIIGAISSLGKTTFCLQIADQMAEQGQDVLIFALEMSENELISKSLSRYTAIFDKAENKTTKNAVTARGITTASRWKYQSKTTQNLIGKAIQTYSEIGKHIYISEGIGNIGVADIREEVKEHIEATGNKPVVIVDYLQILAPYDVRMSDKQVVDYNVIELKRISRDYKIPVLGISSFNRENYTAEVSMESYRASGAIEYSSDVLFGMQFKGMNQVQTKGNNGTELSDKTKKEKMKELIKESKKKIPRGVEVVILKNRNGATGDKVQFEYNPLFNSFIEQGIEKRPKPTITY